MSESNLPPKVREHIEETLERVGNGGATDAEKAVWDIPNFTTLYVGALSGLYPTHWRYSAREKDAENRLTGEYVLADSPKKLLKKMHEAGWKKDNVYFGINAPISNMIDLRNIIPLPPDVFDDIKSEHLH